MDSIRGADYALMGDILEHRTEYSVPPGINAEELYYVDVAIQNSEMFFDNDNNPKQYSVYDLKVGDWIAGVSSGYRAYKIVGKEGPYNTVISDKPPGTNITLIIADIGGYIKKNFLTNNPPDNSEQIVIFRLNSEGLPTIGNVVDITGSTVSETFFEELQESFSSRSLKNQYIYIYQPNHSLAIGDPICITNVNGKYNFMRSTSTSLAILTIGIVTSVNVSTNDWFTFHPFGKYYDDDTVPQGFDEGAVLYINSTGGSDQYITQVIPGNTSVPIWQIIQSDASTNTYSGILIGGSNSSTTMVTVATIIFDGGNATTDYKLEPILDCGSST